VTAIGIRPRRYRKLFARGCQDGGRGAIVKGNCAQNKAGTAVMTKRFRVGFSFACEQRAFVAEVAEILSQQFGRDAILYDKYHAAEFARSNLAFHLLELYEKETDLVVGVFCKEYNIKEWPGLEWRNIYGLIKQKNDATILLSRFDQAEPEGLFKSAGFIELDDQTQEQFADLIRERLAINEGKSRDFYKCSRSAPRKVAVGLDPLSLWPQVAESLALSVANHRESQQVFLSLLSPEAPFQLLRIQGDSQTGKTLLSNEFFRAGNSLPSLRCGRIDFKGSVDIKRVLDDFADHLNLVPPAEGSIVDRLASILFTLKKNPDPTLLIFDSFEDAGVVKAWVRNSLLVNMMRCPWLRIVICGRTTLASRGEPWETGSYDLIQLRRPTPKDWWHYGIIRDDDLKLAFVNEVYARCKGNSYVLAEILDLTY